MPLQLRKKLVLELTRLGALLLTSTLELYSNGKILNLNYNFASSIQQSNTVIFDCKLTTQTQVATSTSPTSPTIPTTPTSTLTLTVTTLTTRLHCLASDCIKYTNYSDYTECSGYTVYTDYCDYTVDTD